ncbi:NDR1/HIN1-like protein 12 [Ananas comosus]|uniref:NDR1/HIN1-like protein 12 n=1 Tax=Ananas comosus TaxID=4615 RepID=A0A6P5F0X8_ANACO|nr:NDR1/HIN1-like protein 12 [Ananas comosus]
MSAKDCDHHGGGYYWGWGRHKFYRRLCAVLLFLVIVALLVILIVWLVLRPSKPKYYLQDVTVYSLNLSSPSYLSTTIQVTLSSKNPNDRVGIYYDKLDVYAEYKNQQITVPTELPTGYQGHDDVSVWSPYLAATNVPLAPYLVVALAEDQTAGYLLIDIKVDGRLRWKVGTWISSNYHISVSCPAFLTVLNGNGNGNSVTGYHFQQISSCTVDV